MSKNYTIIYFLAFTVFDGYLSYFHIGDRFRLIADEAEKGLNKSFLKLSDYIYNEGV